MITQKYGRPIIGITTDVDGVYLRLKHDYCAAVEEAGGMPLLLPFSNDAGPFAEVIHGLLVPGGADLDPAYYHEDMHDHVHPVSRSRSDFEISMLREIMVLRKPVLGICYGMQLLNVFFGGSLYQDISVQLPVAGNHKNGYHRIVITENRFLIHGTFSVNSSHHQAVRTTGDGLSVIARSEDQIIEAFCRKGYPFLVGVQWHPERDRTDTLSRNIFRRFVEISHVGR
jgi:putative glutamine amidotransferase